MLAHSYIHTLCFDVKMWHSESLSNTTTTTTPTTTTNNNNNNNKAEGSGTHGGNMLDSCKCILSMHIFFKPLILNNNLVAPLQQL